MCFRLPHTSSSEKSGLFEGPHIDLNFDGLPAAAESYAFDGSHVTIIPAPGQCDMAVGNHEVIGRIEADPAGFGDEKRNPCMRSLSALDFWTWPHITADISRRQAQ